MDLNKLTDAELEKLHVERQNKLDAYIASEKAAIRKIRQERDLRAASVSVAAKLATMSDAEKTHLAGLLQEVKPSTAVKG